MKNITQEFAANFKKSYTAKMGGSQNLIFPNGQTFFFDEKEYYGGRGSKYNGSIRHDIKGDIFVTKKEVAAVIKKQKERNKIIKAQKIETAEKLKRIAAAEKENTYNFILCENGSKYVEISESETINKTFSVQRLANALKISPTDAALLFSTGKTYVFAKSEDGNIYELYHASLSVNNLHISVSIASPDRVYEFDKKEWDSAPFANILGNTENANHFVC